MNCRKRLISSLFLSVAMLAPIGALALPVPQDEHERREEQRRVYDSAHKEYRNWDVHEDAAYRRWLKERHESYVEYEKLDHKRQEEYWKWRHEHEDHR